MQTSQRAGADEPEPVESDDTLPAAGSGREGQQPLEQGQADEHPQAVLQGVELIKHGTTPLQKAGGPAEGVYAHW